MVVADSEKVRRRMQGTNRRVDCRKSPFNPILFCWAFCALALIKGENAHDKCPRKETYINRRKRIFSMNIG
jgi:hypothetical protein